MDNILKIILFILCVGLGYVTYFIASEYKKFRKSTESEAASLMEKFILGTIAFSTITISICVIIFFVLLLFSTITITLPF
jgi:uncharacterized membrane protein